MRICAVVVTYNPDASDLGQLLLALHPQVEAIVVVDNNSDADLRKVPEIDSATLLELPRNLGIAAAQNRGIEWAFERGFTHVLLSDQDSLPASDMVSQLSECLEEAGPQIAAVGPVPLDSRPEAGPEALVYSFTKWGPKRRSVPGLGQAMEVPFVLASGCLIPLEVLADVGPMNTSLFIDHVDLAWCLRAIERGYRVLVCGSAILYHSLGDDVAKIPGRRRQVHVHSPLRNYYMVRNSLFLLRASFLTTRWKLGYIAWLVKYLGYYTTLAPRHLQRLPLLAQAVGDGLCGRGGAKMP